MMAPRIAIVDYRMCNLFSVEHACRSVGGVPIVTSDLSAINSADAIILPGVGAFKDAIANIRELRLDKAIERAVSLGKAFLGICLGFQLLFSSSEEFGHSEGMGILKGNVRKFPREHDGTRLKIPQIGWNSIEMQKETPFLSGIEDGEYMYFVHSYYVEPQEKESITTTTVYSGLKCCSSVSTGNLFACQFHPEKSGKEGIKIYKNWLTSIR